MRIGELNTLCRVERKPEDHGLGIKLAYKPTGKKLWVNIETLDGSELEAAQRIEARARHILKTHWTADVLTGDRLVAQASGQAFNVVTATNVKNQNRELELVCVEVVN